MGRLDGRIGDGLADVSCHLPPWLSLSLGNLWARCGAKAPSHKGKHEQHIFADTFSSITGH